MPHFIPFGDIRDVHIPVDFHTQKARGFAYIEFEEVHDAENAQKNLQDLVIQGKRISVQFAFGDRKSTFPKTKIRCLTKFSIVEKKTLIFDENFAF